MTLLKKYDLTENLEMSAEVCDLHWAIGYIFGVMAQIRSCNPHLWRIIVVNSEVSIYSYSLLDLM